MVGVLDGGLKLDTAFSTLNLAGPEIKKMVKTAGSPSDVQVVMWDDTTVTGQLQEQELAVKLACGVTMKVPVANDIRVQPAPAGTSKTVIETIKQLVTELNAEDWKQRDAVQEKLIQMGVVVAQTLKQLRDSATPKAQQRIDQILKSVEKDPQAQARRRRCGRCGQPRRRGWSAGANGNEVGGAFQMLIQH